MILWLLACAGPSGPPTTTDAAAWSDATVLSGVRASLDRDADGRVTAAEYERTRWNGPPYGTADADGDGDLSASELRDLLVAQSPASFDGASVAPVRANPPPVLLTLEQRRVWETLLWLGDTLRAEGLPGPDPDAVDRAVATGSFRSPETLAVLAAIRPAWEARGWTWPLPPLPADLEHTRLPTVALADSDPNAAVERRLRAKWADPAASAPIAPPPPTGTPLLPPLPAPTKPPPITTLDGR